MLLLSRIVWGKGSECFDQVGDSSIFSRLSLALHMNLGILKINFWGFLPNLIIQFCWLFQPLWPCLRLRPQFAIRKPRHCVIAFGIIQRFSMTSETFFMSQSDEHRVWSSMQWRLSFDILSEIKICRRKRYTRVNFVRRESVWLHFEDINGRKFEVHPYT